MNAIHYDEKRLSRMIEDAEYTQEQMAEACGVIRLTISRAANGKSASYDLLCKITSICGFPITEILYSQPAEKNLKNFAANVS